MKAPQPPSDLRTKGRDFLWFDHEERYLPVINEGEPMPPASHYAEAERLTKRLHSRRHLGRVR